MNGFGVEAFKNPASEPIRVRKRVLLTALMLTILMLETQAPLKAHPSDDYYQKCFDHVASNISLDNIREHLLNLSFSESKYTGYPGCHRTAAYIYHYLKHVLKLDTWVQRYNALIPYDYNSTLTILYPVKKTFRVYALAPNLIDICKARVRGELIYLGRGSLDALQSKEIAGKIVLLDFNSGANWLLLKSLGARAVVFIEPMYTTFEESSLKVLDIPLKFPRALIRLREAKQILKLLKSGNVSAELVLNMSWRRVELMNILAFIPGAHEDNKDLVMIAVQYDSYSVVPAYTPGASSAVSVAALLEFARILKESRPMRPVLIAAFSGSANAMAGARLFFETRYSMAQRWRNMRIKTIFVFDLSAETQNLALLAQGGFYEAFNWHRAPIRKTLESILQYITSIGEYDRSRKLYRVLGRQYYADILPSYYTRKAYTEARHLAELFNYGGIPAVAFYTLGRRVYRSPADTFNGLILENLRPQLELSYFLLYSLLNDPSTCAKDVFAWQSTWESWGIGGLGGRARYFNSSSLRYESSWSEILEKHHLIIACVKHPGLLEHRFIAEVNSDGTFGVFGLRRSLWWALGEFPYELSVFVLNNRSGEILYVSRRIEDILLRGNRRMDVALFKCGAIAIHGVLLDPRTFYPLDLEIRGEVKLIRLDTREEISSYNIYFSRPSLSDIRASTLAQTLVLFIPSDISIDVLLTDRKTGEPVAFLGNVTLSQGEYFNIYLWEVAGRILKSTKNLLDSLAGDPTLRGSLNFATECYEEALGDYRKCIESLSEGDYSKAFALMYRSLYSARKAYYALRETYGHITGMNLILLFLLLPFALIVEELFFTSQGLRKALYATLVLLLVMAVLIAVHPGFRVHPHLLITFSSIVSLSAAILSLAFLISENYSAIKELRRAILGKHFIETSRLGVSLAVMAVSVRNMRKRLLRTLLTLLTVTLMVVSVVLFASWRFSDTVILRKIEGFKPHGVGLLIKEPPIDRTGEHVVENPISLHLIDYVQGYMGEGVRVYPRARLRGTTLIVCAKTGKEFSAYGNVVGLMPDDPIALSKALIEGSWIDSDDARTAILSDSLKDVLGVSVGDKILLGDLELVVVGIISSEIFQKFPDLDGYLITPLFVTREGIVQEDSLLIIVPFNTLIEMKGVVTSILAYPVNVSRESFLATAKEISEQISGPYEMYYSSGENSYLLTCIRGYELSRPESFLIPFALVCLILSSTMIGSMYERKREISIYASLGLTPTHVALITLTEGIAYSIVGVILGYIAASVISIASQLAGYNVPIDISSPYLPLALLLSMAAVVISSIYPALKASKKVTPSLKRRWSIPTQPLGNKWYVPLPFRTSTLRECMGVMKYLAEYFEKTYSRDFRAIEGPSLKVMEDDTVVLSLVILLAPYDAAISEVVEIVAKRSENGRMVFGIHSELRTGKRYLWISSHRKFVDHVRKQLLLWRGLSPREKKRYLSEAS